MGAHVLERCRKVAAAQVNDTNQGTETALMPLTA
jgi:hypothetical protein